MLFFINPLSNIVQKLANEQERAKLLGNEREFSRLLGLRPVTNSVNEFELYYQKFLGFLIHHLEAAIAEIETDETAEEKPEIKQPEIKQPAIPEIPGYTREEVAAYESIFGEYPPSPAPAVEDIIEPATPTATVETESTQEIDEDLETETITDRMLKAKTKDELDAIKAENPEEVTKLWDTLTIPEKNYIKCIAKSTNAKKEPATLGYKFTYTDPNTKEKHEATYLGYYLHGQALTDENERAINVKGKGLICSKNDLRPKRKQPLLAPGIQQYLEDVLSNPAKVETTIEENPTDTTEEVATEAPTATEMAENTFTGLVETPKKFPTGSMTGKTQSSQLSKQNAEQTTLDLKTPKPQPETSTEAEPTQALKILQEKIAIANSSLSFGYDSFGERTFLEVYHEDDRIGTFEDDGNSIWMKGCSKMYNHGFTDELFEILLDEEALKSPKA